MKRAILFLLLAAGGLAFGGCSDDQYIATNEGLGGASSGGGSSGGASSGGAAGASAGAPSGGGEAGAAGTAGAGGSAGQAGAAGAAGGTGTCTPGEKQDLGSCQKCGTSRRTCDASGAWGDPVCEDQKECNPGDKTATGCTDPCSEKTCSNSCSFGTCGLKTGAKCLYESGSNYQCCGADHWQFCSKLTCDWYPCAACTSGSSCFNVC